MLQSNRSWQKLADLSKRQKEQAQLQLTQALAQQEKLERKLEETRLSLERFDQELVRQQRQGTSVAHLIEASQYAHFLQHRLQENELELDRARRQTVRTQQKVIQLRQEEKKWELMIDKQEQRLRELALRREQMALDEAAIQLYQRERPLGSEQA